MRPTSVGLWISGVIAAGIGVMLFLLDHGGETSGVTAHASCDAAG